ncbi:MAG: family 16 glycosylhydrolase [Opitutaceae bacterium]|jgi:beta-glucanase (GH16 family)|nr:family 16 glycosylhydrolase [Opitutaceae bacterium]
MFARSLALLSLAALLNALPVVASPYPKRMTPARPASDTPVSAPLLSSGARDWKLAWSEEFTGTEADLDRRWISQNSSSTHILSGRWRENVSVSDGTLKLHNRKEKRGANDWTSGNIWTREKFQYGYFEARYRYAAAPATNNSFWIMPTTKGPIAKGVYFEIDINEGHYPNEINTNIHNHSAPKNTPGKRSPRAFSFGTRPDVTIQLENPVPTNRIRFSSTHPGRAHLGEFRVYNANPAGYPDPFSKTADTDKPGLINFARDPASTVTVSGFYKPAEANPKILVDGQAGTRWITQEDGEKWVEVAFAESRVVGCIQFLNGWADNGGWNNLLQNYRVEYHDGSKWVPLARFDIADGEYDFARDYHVYGLEWTPEELVFFFNGREIRREKNLFCHEPSPVWLSLAIIPWGGPITDAIHGTQMEVDYVRIYQRR